MKPPAVPPQPKKQKKHYTEYSIFFPIQTADYCTHSSVRHSLGVQSRSGLIGAWLDVQRLPVQGLLVEVCEGSEELLERFIDFQGVLFLLIAADILNELRGASSIRSQSTTQNAGPSRDVVRFRGE